VKTLAKGASLTDAEIEAGYSSRNPGQSGFQALQQIRGRVPDLLEKHGLGEEILIEKHLKSQRATLTNHAEKENKLQTRLLEELPTSKTVAEAATKAGYSTKNPNQTGYQALKALRGRVPEILDRLGLDEESVIHNHLLPKLTAKQVHYFQRDGEVTEIRLSENLDIQMQAIHRIFQLHGSYTPKDPKEAAQYGVKIIKVDIPRPADTFNQFVDVIPETALSCHGVKPTNAPPANGKPPGDRNGHD